MLITTSVTNRYYQDGYNQGLADGERAGRVEGRIFGLEKGFDKFLEFGTIQGRYSVWKARQESTNPDPTFSSPRLLKHVKQLGELVESVSTKNDEVSVEEFEDTLRRIKAKVRIISSALGEKGQDEKVAINSNRGEESIEDGNFGANVRR